jgi:hypothetical protein
MVQQGAVAPYNKARLSRFARTVAAFLVYMTSRARSGLSDKSDGPVRAAAYVRMSTDQQQYSTENQHAAIQRFAESHGSIIVRSFVDAGKSGVGIQGRDALQDLLSIVESGKADFSTILVKALSSSILVHALSASANRSG